jgi:3-deoxy-7-phosphoheptulonate synthase
MVEVHHAPEEALSDGGQSLYPRQFDALCRELGAFCGLSRRSPKGVHMRAAGV